MSLEKFGGNSRETKPCSQTEAAIFLDLPGDATTEQIIAAYATQDEWNKGTGDGDWVSNLPGLEEYIKSISGENTSTEVVSLTTNESRTTPCTEDQALDFLSEYGGRLRQNPGEKPSDFSRRILALHDRIANEQTEDGIGDWDIQNGPDGYTQFIENLREDVRYNIAA